MADKDKKPKTGKPGEPITMRKITSLAIMGTPISKVAAEYVDGGQVELYKIIGVAHRMRKTRSQFGEGVAFKGKFYVQRTNDKTEFQGPEFIAPPDLSDELQSAFATSPDNKSIEFKASVSIMIDEEAKPLGYAWLSEPIGKIGGQDQLAALAKEAFGSIPKALTGPTR